MTSDHRSSHVLDEYLAELERAASVLPAYRRAELLADIRAHIATARAEAGAGLPQGTDDEAAMLNILGQLGDPSEIVAAAASDLPADALA